MLAETRQPGLSARRVRPGEGDDGKSRRWSNRRSVAARASAGATSRSACSAPWDVSSGRPITTTSSILAAIAGRPVAKLKRGATVADVGCGHGFSTVIMAKAFPNSTFRRLRLPSGSVAQARVMRSSMGYGNTRFEVALASEFPGKDLDLVTFFDCLHDMGDPVGAARHVRQTLKPDGSWMIVEPAAGDRLEDNINPVSRLYYAASTMICVPTSLDQPVGAALGAQAGLGEAVFRHQPSRIPAGAQGYRNAVQHRDRGAALISGDGSPPLGNTVSPPRLAVTPPRRVRRGCRPALERAAYDRRRKIRSGSHAPPVVRQRS